MNDKFSIISNINDPKVFAWIRSNLWVLNYCNSTVELLRIYSIIGNITDPNVLLWIRNNPWTLNYCNSRDELMNAYQKDISDASNVNKTNNFSKKLTNGIVHSSSEPPPHNEFDINRKAAFVNWYGIIITLVLSFAIGYLIAWIILKVH